MDEKDLEEASAALNALLATIGASATVCERSLTFLRAEALGDRVYLLLESAGQGALGKRVRFSVYPILARHEIREEEIRTDLFLNGGKGGQNVNKVETAVRMTHLPTGVTVTCRDERSQLQNKKRAARLLRERVADYYHTAQIALVEEAKKDNSNAF